MNAEPHNYTSEQRNDDNDDNNDVYCDNDNAGDMDLHSNNQRCILRVRIHIHTCTSVVLCRDDVAGK